MDHLDRSVRGVRWLASSRIVIQIVTWALTIFSVRLLRPADYGLVATSGLFTVYAGLIMDGGLAVLLIQRPNLAPQTSSTASGFVLCSASLLYGVIWLMAPAGAHFFSQPPLEMVLRVAALQLPLSALSVAPYAQLSRDMRFRELAIAQALTSVSQGLITLCLAYYGFGYWSLVTSQLVGQVVRFLALWLPARTPLIPQIHVKELRPLLAEGRFLLGSRTIAFCISDFDTFLLSRFHDPKTLGTYTVARNLSHAPLDRLAEVLNQVLIPAFALRSGDREGQLRGVLFLIRITAAFSFPMFWLIGVVAPDALAALFGARWTASILPFVIFCFFLPIRTMYSLLDSAIVGSGENSTAMKNMLLWPIILAPALLFAVPRFGALGAACSWAVCFPVIFLLAVRRIARKLETTAPTLLAPLILPALFAAASAALAYAIEVVAAGHLPILVVCIFQAAAGLATYVLVYRIMSRTAYDEVMDLGRRLLNRGRQAPI